MNLRQSRRRALLQRHAYRTKRQSQLESWSFCSSHNPARWWPTGALAAAVDTQLALQQQQLANKRLDFEIRDQALWRTSSRALGLPKDHPMKRYALMSSFIRRRPTRISSPQRPLQRTSGTNTFWNWLAAQSFLQFLSGLFDDRSN